MKRLRWKLLAAMIALVVVTLGISWLFTRRVARDQVVRLMEMQPAGSLRQATSPMEDQALRALEAHVRSAGGWRDVDAVIDQLSAAQSCRIILTTTRGDLIAVSAALRAAKVAVEGEDHVTVTGVPGDPVDRLVMYVMPLVVRDVAGRAVAHAYVLPGVLPAPDHQDPAVLREIAAVDRRLLAIFAVAALVALLLTVVVSRHITRPVEAPASNRTLPHPRPRRSTPRIVQRSATSRRGSARSRRPRCAPRSIRRSTASSNALAAYGGRTHDAHPRFRASAPRSRRRSGAPGRRAAAPRRRAPRRGTRGGRTACRARPGPCRAAAGS